MGPPVGANAIGSNVIVFGPAEALAAPIASRKVQPPGPVMHAPSVVSAVEFTLSVAGIGPQASPSPRRRRNQLDSDWTSRGSCPPYPQHRRYRRPGHRHHPVLHCRCRSELDWRRVDSCLFRQQRHRCHHPGRKHRQECPVRVGLVWVGCERTVVAPVRDAIVIVV